MNVKIKTLIDNFLSGHPIEIITMGGGILITLLNLYITTQLTPLNQNITILATKVDAIETVDKSFVSQDQLTQINVELQDIQNTLNILISKK